MKICPRCQTQYTDETLRFCLQDGSPLVGHDPDGPITVTSREAGRSLSDRESPYTSAVGDDSEWPTRVAAPAPRQEYATRTSPVRVALLTALATALVLGILGVGAWMYINRGDGSNAINNNSAAGRTNAGRQDDTTPVPTRTPALNSNTNATNANTRPTRVEIDQIKRDLSAKVGAWRSASEALDLSTHMSFYADRVDYYNRRNATREYVRRDKERAFKRFETIRINLGDITVTVDDGGEAATSVFDKEWVFDGPTRSAGKVRSQLRWRKIGGEWRITGERDLQVYRVE